MSPSLGEEKEGVPIDLIQQPYEALLRALPTPALLTEHGRAAAWNDAFAALLPGLAPGQPLPEELFPCQRAGASGYAALPGGAVSFRFSPVEGEWLLLTLTPASPRDALSGERWDILAEQLRRELSDLLMALCRAVPELRIRLGSLEPRTITREFCQRMKGFPNLCPQFHLSLQSGSDRVLKRMNRKYDTARYRESVELLRQHFPGCAVTTDLIVGFPGETEEEFAQSLAFLETCRFAWVHVFPYSRRPGTPAAAMAGQVPRAVQEERVHRAMDAAREMGRAWLERQVGKVFPVLFEEEKAGLWQGHAPNYALVHAPGKELHNRVVPVRITGVREDGLLGEVAET